MKRKVKSSIVVIDRIKRLFNIQASGWQGEMISELAHAITGIGYHIGLKEDVIDKEICNHITKIPTKLTRLTKVEYNNQRIPITKDSSLLKLARNIEDKKSKLSNEDYEQLNKMIARYEQIIEEELNGSTVDYSDEKERLIKSIKKEYKFRDLTPDFFEINQQESYYIDEHGYLITTFPEGTVYLYGKFIETDEEGYPMIVDEFNYIEALTWYGLSVLLLKGYKTPANIGYDYASQKWELYRRKASSAGKRLSIDEHEQFARYWGRYVRNASLYDSGFKGAEQRTQL